MGSSNFGEAPLQDTYCGVLSQRLVLPRKKWRENAHVAEPVCLLPDGVLLTPKQSIVSTRCKEFLLLISCFILKKLALAGVFL